MPAESSMDQRDAPLREHDPESQRAPVAALSVEGRDTASSSSASTPTRSTASAGSKLQLAHFGLFVLFALSRAIHPILIEESKVRSTEVVDGERVTTSAFAHEAMSVPLVECIVTLAVVQGMCFVKGGVSEWREIWRPAPFSMFSAIGVVYAFGDFLELQSLGCLSGIMYQVLSQSKLIITAFMLWGITGQKQTRLQWILLVSMMMSLVCYTIMKDLLEKHQKLVQANMAGDESSVNLEATIQGCTVSFGMTMAVLKVTVSCLCAVLSDKYMKAYKTEPIHVQIAQFKVAWLVTVLALTLLNSGPKVWSDGIFHDWSYAVACSAVSFVFKGWSTMYLLAIMDSMLKNIGEACTVLFTYFVVVIHPGNTDEYDFEALMTLVQVFVSVMAYYSSKYAFKAKKNGGKAQLAKTAMCAWGTHCGAVSVYPRALNNGF